MTEVKNNNYKKALVEVEAILSCLNYMDYKKIPQNIIEAIKVNKDENYIFEYDENLDYKDWNLMLETKAILYNIFKQYLATNEQKEYYKQKELIERNRIEKEKKQKYNVDNLFKVKSLKENQQEEVKENSELIKYKEPILKRIINKIKAIFGKK